MLISSPDDVERLVAERGFLPFFAGEIIDFSLEEVTPQQLWFPDDKERDDRYGVWDWKGQVIIEGDCAYGKFYQQKACFISMEWFPDFVNYRRSTHTLSADETIILNTLKERKSLLSKELKRLSGYVVRRQPRIVNPVARAANTMKEPRPKSTRQSFDTAITRLQMSGHVVTADFEYNYDRQGRRYGWGVARYCTPEDFFGPERIDVNRTPEESRQRLTHFLTQSLPQATPKQIEQIVLG